MTVKLPLKSVIGGVLVAVSSVVCALAYMQDAATDDAHAPLIVENENSR